MAGFKYYAGSHEIAQYASRTQNVIMAWDCFTKK